MCLGVKLMAYHGPKDSEHSLEQRRNWVRVEGPDPRKQRKSQDHGFWPVDSVSGTQKGWPRNCPIQIFPVNRVERENVHLHSLPQLWKGAFASMCGVWHRCPGRWGAQGNWSTTLGKQLHVYETESANLEHKDG